MSLKFRILHFMFIALQSIILIGCDKDILSLPVGKGNFINITTSEINSITANSAKCNFIVSDLNSETVTEQGICWDITKSPTTSGNKVSLPLGTGSFTAALSNLAPNQTYYLRPYIKLGTGTTMYGDQKYFVTKDINLPTLQDISLSKITTNGAQISAAITDDGGSKLLDFGILYSTNVNPSLSDNKISLGPSVYSFTISINNLRENTIYYVRPYASNSKGVALGKIITFRTVSISDLQTKASLSNGLQVYYPFNGNANDISGNQKNGIVYNATLTKDRYGIQNSAYNFNGIPGTKIQTNYPGVLGNNSRTISLWVRRPLQAFNGSFLLTWGTQASGASFGLFMSGRDQTQFFGVDNGGSTVQTIFNSLWDGNWHHYVMVYDNSIGNNILNVKIYIDGNYYPIAETWNPQNINTTQGINMVIGEYSSAQSDWRTTNGEIDDIGVWNRALTIDEINYLYKNNYVP